MILPKNVVTVPVNFRGLCDFGGDYMLTPSQANLKFLQFGVRCMTEDVVGLDVPIMEEANLTPPVILLEIAGLMIRAYDNHWFPLRRPAIEYETLISEYFWGRWVWGGVGARMTSQYQKKSGTNMSHVDLVPNSYDFYIFTTKKAPKKSFEGAVRSTGF